MKYKQITLTACMVFGLSGCATDAAIHNADRLCYAEAKLNTVVEEQLGDYRKCMSGEWEDVKATAGAVLDKIAEDQVK